MLLAAQNSFLNWLLDPRDPKRVDNFPEGTDCCKGEQQQVAEHLRVEPTALTHWKRDPEFVSEWQSRLTEISGGPERLARHLDRLDEIAMGSHAARAADSVTAIKLHAEMVGTFTPKRKLEVNDPRLARAADETLFAKMDEWREFVGARRNGNN